MITTPGRRRPDKRPYRKPLCPKCQDQGWVIQPAKLRGIASVRSGSYRKVACLKGCAASKRWLAEQGGKS